MTTRLRQLSAILSILFLLISFKAYSQSDRNDDEEETRTPLSLTLKYSPLHSNTEPPIHNLFRLPGDQYAVVGQYLLSETTRFFGGSYGETDYRFPYYASDLMTFWGLKLISDQQFQAYSSCNQYSFIGGPERDCESEAYQRTPEFVDDYFDFLRESSVDEIVNRAKSDLSYVADLFPENEMRAAAFALKAMTFETFVGTTEFLSTESPNLTPDERRVVMQVIAQMAYEGFDRELLAVSTRDRVTPEMIWESSRSRFLPNQNGQFELLGSGVSRHHGNYLATMAEAMGYINTYAVGYSVHGSLHGAAYWEDEESNAYVIEFRKQGVHNQITGPAVLNSPRDEYTSSVISWRISEPNGGTVRDIPSELLIRLTEIIFSEEDAQRLYPGYVDRGWHAAFEAGNLKLFSAQDSFGNYFFGIAIADQLFGSADQIRNPSILSGKGAAAAYYLDHNNADPIDYGQKAVDVFLGYQMLIRTPRLSPYYDIGLRGRFGVSLLGGQFFEGPEGQDNGNYHVDGDARATLGVGGHIGNPDGCFLAEFEAYREFTPALKNVLDPAHTIGIKRERDIAMTDISICTSMGENGPKSGFNLGGILLNDVIADAYVSSIDYWYRGVTLGVGVQGSFSDYPPAFHEGSQSYYTGRLEARFMGAQVRVNGALPRDDRSKPKAGVSVHIPIRK